MSRSTSNCAKLCYEQLKISEENGKEIEKLKLRVEELLAKKMKSKIIQQKDNIK
ncbi:hypothetical protein [Spiroplasma culicicola]|uniref:Uncharacterized protein n=1 Tax=Spiroplasma culicicola AES-1 TaxID=1276246 RepID=W6A679_9MOLU|nr:hypothetical protein [Spiroplasma culicicola]AHI52502.1 hypothetical protein SCULI_v1c01610 [Spiroplasma culicicola AES-1]